MTNRTIRPDFQRPEHIRDLWRVQQGPYVLAASMWTHPLGIELRVIDERSELLYSTTFSDPAELLAKSGEWKAGKLASGWSEYVISADSLRDR